MPTAGSGPLILGQTYPHCDYLYSQPVMLWSSNFFLAAPEFPEPTPAPAKLGRPRLHTNCGPQYLKHGSICQKLKCERRAERRRKKELEGMLELLLATPETRDQDHK